jgi:predicted membrane protein
VKMGNLFWPVLLIIAGALMLVKTLLHINIPVFKVLLAVGLIWGGISLISSGVSHKPASIGSRMEITDTEIEYTVMFDSSEIDLSDEYIAHDRLTIDCVFGKTVVILPRDRAVHIEASGAFCSLRSPGGRTITFGEGTYDCGSGQPLLIEANCAFGELIFVEAGT